MAREIDIEIVLTGAEQAKKSLGDIGETAGKMADKFQGENEKLGEGLSSLSGSVTSLAGSFKDLRKVMDATGAGGAASLLKFLGPIGAVAAAAYALYEAFMQISGAAQEAENRTQAMSAAASDLQSKLESLAEKGVLPNTEALKEFTIQTIRAQVAKELLEKRFEKLAKSYGKVLDATDNLTKSTKAYNRESGAFEEFKMAIGVTDSVKEARDKLTDSTKAFTKEIQKLLPLQNEVNKTVSEAEKNYKGFEETSAEATLGRVKENIALLNTLKLRKAEIESTGKALKAEQIRINALKESLLLQADRNKEDAKTLGNIEKKLKEQIKEFNQEKDINALRDAQIARLDQKKEESTKRNLKRIDTSRIKELAIERQKQADLRKLRQLELQQMRLDGASSLQIATERYRDALIAAKGNQEQILIAEKEYQLEITRMNNEANQQRMQQDLQRAEQEKQQRIHASQLAYSSLEFDLNMRKDGIDKELSLLELKYAKERELNATTQAEITELNRREAIERTSIINKTAQAQIDKFGEVTSMYAAGLAESAFNALLFGESFRESVGEMLIALGRQAAVQGLIETAKGTAALFTQPQLAANHFAAAGLFGGAAAAAGIAGKALGGGGSAAGGGGSTSPTGAPATTQAPERERAEQTQTVFNINFSGAVIYDSQRAAEQALADRITTLQNTNRRGAPRRRA